MASEYRLREGPIPPTPAAGTVVFFVDLADKKLKQKDDAGVVKDLTADPAFPVDDTTALVRDPADNTKLMRIDVGAVATATTRVASMPDRNITLVDRLGLVVGGGDPFVAANILDATIKRILETGGATLLAGAIADGEFFKRSGTNFIGGPAIYTSFYNNDDSESTTTGTAFVQKLRLTFTALATDYDITWSCDISQDTAGEEVIYRFQEDDIFTLNAGEIQSDTNDGASFTTVGATVRRTLTAASHDFDIDFSSTTGGNTARIRNARILAIQAI